MFTKDDYATLFNLLEAALVAATDQPTHEAGNLLKARHALEDACESAGFDYDKKGQQWRVYGRRARA